MRVKNITGGTKVVLGKPYMGNYEYEVSENLRDIFIRNGFEILGEEVAETPPEETLPLEEVDEVAPSPDFSSMTKRKLQSYLKEKGIAFEFKNTKAQLLSLCLNESEEE
tara:strand:- start:1244 stop:1570 length:327 start_codon:yes stop_codon:yes gene_type:complete